MLISLVSGYTQLIKLIENILYVHTTDIELQQHVGNMKISNQNSLGKSNHVKTLTTKKQLCTLSHTELCGTH